MASFSGFLQQKFTIPALRRLQCHDTFSLFGMVGGPIVGWGSHNARRMHALKKWFLTSTSALALMAAPLDAEAVTISFTGASTTFTVLTTGTYDIAAFGAQGGSSGSNVAGGLGAHVGGTFSLTAGDNLTIAVGGQGGQGGPGFGGYGGGGGGGSFIFNSTASTLMLIAGGGGGGYTGFAGGVGLATLGGAGGGGTGSVLLGGGGGGFLGSGSGGGSPAGGFPGLAGGATGWGGGAAGGFGGGGASGGYGAGGGGGYTGGNAGVPGGGGGSFVSGLNQFAFAGVNAGNGQVTIDLVAAAEVPEPASVALLGAGLAGLGLLRRRKSEPA